MQLTTYSAAIIGWLRLPDKWSEIKRAKKVMGVTLQDYNPLLQKVVKDKLLMAWVG